MKYNLDQVCYYVKEKIKVSELSKSNYISTENMLPNKCGIRVASVLPKAEYVQKYIKDDILISNIRPYFKKIWRADRDGGCSNDVLVLRANECCNSKFLYYSLANDAFFNYATSTAKGTKMPRGDKNAIMEYQIPAFTKAVQGKIGDFLSKIDIKIDNNIKINDNLLEQMQVLYKSWFVDFVPFGGSKPRTWVETDIYELANIIYGAPFKSKQFNTDGIGKPIIRIRDLKDQQFATYTTEVHPKGYLLQPGDIVVGMDGEFRPYIWGNNEAWLNQRVCVFENKRPNGKAFLYFTIKPLLYEIEQTQVATTVIHIGKKDFDAFEITLPDASTLNDFDALTAPMIRVIVLNSFENKKLAATRDILLPKLMSGEIDVSDIQL